MRQTLEQGLLHDSLSFTFRKSSAASNSSSDFDLWSQLAQRFHARPVSFFFPLLQCNLPNSSTWLWTNWNARRTQQRLEPPFTCLLSACLVGKGEKRSKPLISGSRLLCNNGKGLTSSTAFQMPSSVIACRRKTTKSCIEMSIALSAPSSSAGGSETCEVTVTLFGVP